MRTWRKAGAVQTVDDALNFGGDGEHKASFLPYIISNIDCSDK